MALQTAVVIGATGLIGGNVVKQLLDDEAFGEVVVLVRGSFALTHPKLKVRMVNFNDMADYKAKLGKGDAIFCCVGTTQKKVKGDMAAYRKIDHDIPVNAATIGKQAGFNTFLLVSAIGANAKASNFYLKLKGEVDEEIASTGLTNINIFRPSLLLGKRNEKRFGEGIMQSVGKVLTFLLVGGLRKYKPIDAADVAKAMIAAAKKAAPGNHVYEYIEMVELIG